MGGPIEQLPKVIIAQQYGMSAVFISGWKMLMRLKPCAEARPTNGKALIVASASITSTPSLLSLALPLSSPS